MKEINSWKMYNLSRWGDLATKKFQPECGNEKSSTESRS